MSNTQSRILEQIEREFQPNGVGTYEIDLGLHKQAAALRGAEIALENQCKDVSRIEVIDEHGRQFVKYFKGECKIDYQDDNRTMKIFITPPKP